MSNQFFTSDGNWIDQHSLHTNVYHKDMNDLWQGFVIYTREIKTGLFKKIIVPFIFYCEVIFTSKEDCAKTLGSYVKKLIERGELPASIIKENKIDEKVIKTGVRKISIGVLSEVSN